MVGVVPNAAYRHFADRDELLAAVCTAAMRELAARMAVGVGRVRGKHGDAGAARRRLYAIGRAYLEFAREEPGLFATAFALPQQHAYDGQDGKPGEDPMPLDQLRAVLDELTDAGVLNRRRRAGMEYPIWSTVHGLAVLTGQGPLRGVPDATRRHLEEVTRAFIEGSLAQNQLLPVRHHAVMTTASRRQPSAGSRFSLGRHRESGGQDRDRGQLSMRLVAADKPGVRAGTPVPWIACCPPSAPVPGSGLFFEPEANLQSDLPVRHLAAFNLTADLGDFEPVEVP
jgi:AcrR family transcriptional regulator